MNEEQKLRYSRHTLLKDMGEAGQEKISQSSALVIGAGGLGSAALIYLASSGMGKITIVDDDIVEVHNLQRQIIHTTERCGTLKAASAKTALHGINPTIDVQIVTQRMDEDALPTLVKDVDVVLDCTDNFATRIIVNRVCMKLGKPLISGAAVAFDGQISVYDPRQENCPCYACLYPQDMQFTDIKAAQVGVFAPVVGLVGVTQAAEALKVVGGIGKPLTGRLLLLDGLNMEWTTLQMERNPDCPVCSKRNVFRK